MNSGTNLQEWKKETVEVMPTATSETPAVIILLQGREV